MFESMNDAARQEFENGKLKEKELFLIRIKLPPAALVLEQREKEFQRIQQAIQLKKHFLLKKQNKIQMIAKENAFLEEVQQDYLKYYNHISEQKRNQMNALHLLKTHIANLTEKGELSNQQMEDAKEQQKRILNEIDHIKQNLDSMIDGTT